MQRNAIIMIYLSALILGTGNSLPAAAETAATGDTTNIIDQAENDSAMDNQPVTIPTNPVTLTSPDAPPASNTKSPPSAEPNPDTLVPFDTSISPATETSNAPKHSAARKHSNFFKAFNHF